MKITTEQITQIKTITVADWFQIKRIHGNTKKIGSLPVNVYKEVLTKKLNRFDAKYVNSERTPVKIVRSLIKNSIPLKGTPYFKIMIAGNSNIYYASPIYGFDDYNKACLFPKNETTLNLMRIFNAIVNK